MHQRIISEQVRKFFSDMENTTTTVLDNSFNFEIIVDEGDGQYRWIQPNLKKHETLPRGSTLLINQNYENKTYCRYSQAIENRYTVEYKRKDPPSYYQVTDKYYDMLKN